MQFSFDTTSYETWVKSNDCQSCISKSAFQPSSSLTYNPNPRNQDGMSYPDGPSLQGIYFQDTLSIGKIKVKNFTMLQVDSMKGFNNIPESDGILGLRLNSINRNGFIDQAYSQGLIPRPLLSFYINENNESGEMIIGGYDESKIDGDIIWASTSRIQFASDQKKSLEESWTLKLNSYHLHFPDRNKTLYVDGQVIFSTCIYFQLYVEH